MRLIGCKLLKFIFIIFCFISFKSFSLTKFDENFKNDGQEIYIDKDKSFKTYVKDYVIENKNDGIINIKDEVTIPNAINGEKRSIYNENAKIFIGDKCKIEGTIYNKATNNKKSLVEANGNITFSILNNNGNGSIINDGDGAIVKIITPNKDKIIKGNILSYQKAKTELLLDTVNSKMKGNIYSGSDSIVNLTLKNGAKFEGEIINKALTQSTGGKISINCIDNSICKIKGEPLWKSSEVYSIKLKNAYLDLSDESLKKLNIKNISGENGTFLIKVIKNGDKIAKTDIIIEKAEDGSKHKIELSDESIESLKNYNFSDNNKIELLKSPNNLQLEVKNTNKAGAIFSLVPKLTTKKENDKTTFFISSIENVNSDIVEDFEDDNINLYQTSLSRLEIDSLYKRIGDLNFNRLKNGFWTKTTVGQSKTNNNFNSFQLGFDKKYKNTIFGFSFANKDNFFKLKDGKAKSNIKSILLYSSYFKDMHFFDMTAKVSKINNSYNLNFENFNDEAKYSNYSFGLSSEYGYKMNLGNFVFIPNIQLSYNYTKGAKYKTSNNISVEQNNIDSLLYKMALYVGKNTKTTSTFLKFGIYKDFLADFSFKASASDGTIKKNLTKDIRDVFIELGIFGTIDLDVNKFLYYEFEKIIGNDNISRWQASLGFRYNF